MKASVWTPERVETLKSLWAQRYSAADIARTLDCGLTRCAVLGKVHRLDLPTHAAPPKLHRTFTRTGMPPKPKRPAKPAIEAPAPLNIAFLDLQPPHCRYPVSDAPPHLFCGQSKQPGSSYCPHHHALAHTEPPELSEEERDRRASRVWWRTKQTLALQRFEEDELGVPPPLSGEAA